MRESHRLKGRKGFSTKTRHRAEQIVAKLRQADVELGKGLKVPEVCKALGIRDQSYYRWRTKDGGMAPEMAKEMKAPPCSTRASRTGLA